MIYLDRKEKFHLLASLAVMLFIFVHSAMPGSVSGEESRPFADILVMLTGMDHDIATFIVRKAAHFTEFTILGICFSLSMSDIVRKRGVVFKRQICRTIIVWIAGVLYAVTDEIHQIFVEGRSCSATDVMIDAAGVALGIVIYSLFKRMRATGTGDDHRGGRSGSRL